MTIFLSAIWPKKNKLQMREDILILGVKTWRNRVTRPSVRSSSDARSDVRIRSICYSETYTLGARTRCTSISQKPAKFRQRSGTTGKRAGGRRFDRPVEDCRGQVRSGSRGGFRAAHYHRAEELRSSLERREFARKAPRPLPRSASSNRFTRSGAPRSLRPSALPRLPVLGSRFPLSRGGGILLLATHASIL